MPVNHSEFSIVKLSDKASAVLGNGSADADSFDSSKVTTEPTAQQPYLEYTLKDVKITSYSFNGGLDVDPSNPNVDLMPDDVVVGAGPGAPGGHVKVFAYCDLQMDDGLLLPAVQADEGFDLIHPDLM